MNTMLGVPITTIIAFWGLYWGPRLYGNYSTFWCTPGGYVDICWKYATGCVCFGTFSVETASEALRHTSAGLTALVQGLGSGV